MNETNTDQSNTFAFALCYMITVTRVERIPNLQINKKKFLVSDFCLCLSRVFRLCCAGSEQNQTW